MPEYRRLWIPGAMYAFTVALADRRSSLLIDRLPSLRAAFRQVKLAHPFEIHTIVILPEHLHTVWRLPTADADYSMRWRLIKSAFSKDLPARPATGSQARRGEKGVWQRRFWEHLIRDEDDLRRHSGYIHWNPVKHGHANQPDDWEASSIHRHRRRKILPPGWEAEAREIELPESEPTNAP